MNQIVKAIVLVAKHPSTPVLAAAFWAGVKAFHASTTTTQTHKNDHDQCNLLSGGSRNLPEP